MAERIKDLARPSFFAKRPVGHFGISASFGEILSKRFDALNRLWEKVRESNHDFRATTEIFPNLDVDRIARDLELAEKGSRRGSENQPPRGAKSMDDVELAIVERVEEEKKAAHHLVEDHLQLFADRLTNLDFEGQFGMIRQANASSVSDFKAEVAMGVDELHGLRRHLTDAENELAFFRKQHGLARAARVSEGPVYWLKISFLIFLFIVETILNGVFLAKGSELGIIGGITEAMSFSFLNLGIALLAAIFCVRLVTHRSAFVKIVGTVSILAYAALAIVLNLALAHYREVSGTLIDQAGPLVMNRLREDPLNLSDIKSWLLFGIGLLFSLGAFIDGWYFKDPYPGYSGVEKRLRTARDRYVTRKQDLIEGLKDIRDDHNEKVEEIIKNLSGRRREYSAIIDHRGKMLALFAQHQDHLERAANMLLRKYREANTKARSEPAPKHFAVSYKLERIKPTRPTGGEWNDSELAESIRSAQADLSEQVTRIGTECEQGIEQYHQLDKLFPGASNG
jgi:hypothetical protein